ncbi:ABC transporter ATP-binding protein [Tomitella biformata]|uniref:ABC transporter ATP-binding protein n=1 Tax=Tomitella biformata TaxID=630403 RepID=UPI0004653AB8|nr:ABC transporter ATP-binding protein [Tomitella biformata]
MTTPTLPPGEKPQQFLKSMRRLVLEMGHEARRFAVVLTISVIAVGMGLVAPLVMGHATDLLFSGFIGRQLPEGITNAQAVEALRGEGQNTFADMVASMNVVPGTGIDFPELSRVIFLILAIFVVASALSWLQAYLLNIVVQNTVYRLRKQVEAKFHRLPLRYFDKTPRGEVLSRVTNDVDNMQTVLGQTINQLVTSFLTLIGVLVLMLYLSPLLTLISIALIPVSLFAVSRIAKKAQPLFKQQWVQTGLLNAHIEETFSGHDLVRVYGHQRQVEEHFGKVNDELVKSSFGSQFLSGMITPIMGMVGNLNYVLLAVVGGIRITSGTLTLGDLQAFIQYSRQFSQPLTQIAAMANRMQSGIASAERVYELLDTEEFTPDEEIGGRHSPAYKMHVDGILGQVDFNDVVFRYDEDVPLIEGLSLQVSPGQTVAIVGPTGAGKTTLVNLILRFYEVNSGAITIDGVNIADVPRHLLRSRIGMVLQDTWLFEGTIWDNIAYGLPGATDEQIRTAASATFVDSFVQHLPDGYQTVLGADGGSVSAGQMQLITIARAFLAQPSILILDEATSSVDTRTELLLQDAMRALRTNRTSFIIAHRLSTIRDADVILVMESGAIVEQGSHEQLLAAGGVYAELHNAQFIGAPSA